MGFFDFLFGAQPEEDPRSGTFQYPTNQNPKLGEGGIAALQSGRVAAASPYMTAPWRVMDYFFNDYNPSMNMYLPQFAQTHPTGAYQPQQQGFPFTQPLGGYAHQPQAAQSSQMPGQPPPMPVNPMGGGFLQFLAQMAPQLTSPNPTLPSFQGQAPQGQSQQQQSPPPQQGQA